MRRITMFLIFLFCSALFADNLEKTQKKQLEAQVKSMTAEAQPLEKAGQLGDRGKALEYLGKARMGTGDSKEKQKLMQLQTFFTTGENWLSANGSSKDRIIRINQLSDSIGLEASLEDKGGVEESFFEDDSP